MTIWVLWCWALDKPGGEVVSWHPTFDTVVYAALAWIEADRDLLPRQRSVYSICEIGADEPLP